MSCSHTTARAVVPFGICHFLSKLFVAFPTEEFIVVLEGMLKDIEHNFLGIPRITILPIQPHFRECADMLRNVNHSPQQVPLILRILI